MTGLPDGYRFIEYDPVMAPDLVALEQRAARRFADFGFPHLAHLPPMPLDKWKGRLAGADIWVVAGDTEGTPAPCGFAIGTDLGDLYWICEISVNPAHGGRGIGKALLDKLVERARWAFHSAIGLSTFRDIPFNAPFYARNGFLEVPAARSEGGESDPASARFWLEVPEGVHPSTRVLMLKRL